jgi:hypothetical protein
MADIISFIPRERSEARPRDGEPASVIMFPGVRYERTENESARDSEPPAAGERPGRRGKRRKSS